MQYYSSSTHRVLYVYVILNAAPLRTFQVSNTRLSSTGSQASQFLPGPNSTGRRFIHHFHPKFNFLRASSAGTNSRVPFPAVRALRAPFPHPLLLQPSACRVLTTAGRHLLRYFGHVKRE